MSVIHDLIYLTACAVQEKEPDPALVAAMEQPTLFDFSSRHKMAAMVAMALEALPGGPESVLDPAIWRQWAQARDQAIRRAMLFDAERRAILAFLEEAGIWYMPLKGILLQELYPRYGMREMTDNDILYDAAFQETLFHFMTERGYRAKSVGKGADDIYLKDPIYNFEMHRTLFDREGDDTATAEAYYRDVKKRLIKDEDNAFGYHFSDEDEYLFLTAHTAKHFAGCGVGVRALVDNFVFRRARGGDLRWTYIEEELEKLGLTELEGRLRRLADRLFLEPDAVYRTAWTQEELELLGYMASSGAFGNMEQLIDNRLRRLQPEGEQMRPQTRLRYMWGRLFPPADHMKRLFPMFEKHPALRPFLYLYRLLLGLVRNGRPIRKEIRALFRKKR